jgi:excisionase family DNA binding protein
MRNQDVLTTGEVARICGVSPRTVMKWVDGKLIPGCYALPGSRDRRIPRASLIAFTAKHGMAPPDTMDRRVLLIGDSTQALFVPLETAGWSVRHARSSFVAGTLAAEFRPSVVVVDRDLGCLAAGEIAAAMGAVPVLLHGHHERWAAGFVGVGLPFDVQVAAIEAVVDEMAKAGGNGNGKVGRKVNHR